MKPKKPLQISWHGLALSSWREEARIFFGLFTLIMHQSHR